MSSVMPDGMAAGRRSQTRFEAFFSYGFRPFFLGAAVYAALAMSIWLTWVFMTAAGWPTQWLPVAGSPYAWHAHEMVFGFAVAALAGFLLTAVPNWTGALPLSGLPLVLLFLTWLAGRFAMAFSGLLPSWAVAVADIAFVPVLAAFAAKQLFVKPAARNLIFLAILAAMTVANVSFHLSTQQFVALDPMAVIRTTLLMVVVMIAIIGGRIIPAFTHNWLHLHSVSGPMPRRFNWLDSSSILSTIVYAFLQASAMPQVFVGYVALIAAILNSVRLFFWRGWATRSEPIVWVLHLGYAWLVIGLVMGAASALTQFVPGAIASHAFGTGAAGTMILGVMSRASLGHTGRPIVAPRAIVWAYALVSLAAMLRVAGPLLATQHSAYVLTGAGLAWVAAFALFAYVYMPILTTPRVHTKIAHS